MKNPSKLRFGLTSLVVISALLSCQSAGPSSTLKEANEVHQASIMIHKDCTKVLDSLKIVHDGNVAVLTKLDSLTAVLTTWEENLWEVPGFEHDHDHNHQGHHHTPAPSMTDASMLEYQLEARKAVEEVKELLRAIR
jgi:hypothetical protein